MPREISRLMNVNQRSKGLRLNIPRRIVAELELQAQDIVEWEISSTKGKKSACIVKFS